MRRKTEQLIVAEIPRLRRYARSLCLDREEGDDLVQATLDRALGRLGYWRRGTDIRAWLMTIMHNIHVNNLKSRSRAAPTVAVSDDVPGAAAGSDRGGLLLRDLERGLARLSDDHREALLLVGMEQYSYKEAAKIAGISIGTLMSRLHRARQELHAHMHGDARRIRRVK